jgi:recombination protein RecT
MNDVAPIRALIDPHRSEIVPRLPKYLSAEQFFQLCYAIERNGKLAAAARRNPDSLLAAILKAADCGLMPGSAYDHCWLIPYGDEIQFQVGYRGLVYQLMRAGAIIKLTPAVVYDGDHFDLELGDREHLTHKPNLTDDRRRNAQWLFDKRNIVGAYAVAWLPLPTQHMNVAAVHRWVPAGEIEAARMRSKVPDGPAWTQNYPAMASKTAVRRTCKLIEVCGPTDENKEAWDRYGRTIELDNSQYRYGDDEHDNDEPDDLPEAKPVRLMPPRSGQAAGSPSIEHGAPPPPNGGRKKPRVDAQTPPQPKPAAAPLAEPEEPISIERQDDLIGQAGLAGMRSSQFNGYVKEKYRVSVSELTSSQADEVAKYLKGRMA